MNSAAVRTEEKTEAELNEFFSGLPLNEAMEFLSYLTVPNRYRKNTTMENIKKSFFEKSVGTLLKEFDPTAFYVEMSC